MLCWTDLDRHAPHPLSLFRMKAGRTEKVSKVLDQLFKMYDLQVGWLHFLMPDEYTTVDFGFSFVEFDS